MATGVFFVMGGLIIGFGYVLVFYGVRHHWLEAKKKKQEQKDSK